MKKGGITVSDVAISLGGRKILDGISFTVKPGDSLIIIGPSGCGKSVLLKVMLGMMKPDRGSAILHGTPRIGMVFQYGALLDSLSVWENIAFYPQTRLGVTDLEANALAGTLLREVGLSKDILEKQPSELSGGMKKRVALARALAVKPEILISDEPTSGLDPVTSAHINALIAGEANASGRTGVTVTHSMETAQTVGGQVILLYGGKIVWKGRADKMSSSRNPYLNQFARGALEGPIVSGELVG